MNKEVLKAMNKKEKKHPFRKWWNKNGHKVMRVIFFPIWICVVIVEKIQKALNDRQVWSEDTRSSSVFSTPFIEKADFSPSYIRTSFVIV